MSDLPHYGSIRELADCSLHTEKADTLESLMEKPKVFGDNVVTIEHPENADTPESLAEKIKFFGDNVVKVDQAFNRVKKGLGEVDAKGYKDKDGNLIPKLKSTWVGYQKRWTKLFWKSRGVATNTEAYIDDFLEVIVPVVEAAIEADSEDDLDVARLNLDQFLKVEPAQPQRDCKIGEEYVQGFANLKSDLETFQVTFVQHYDSAIKEKRAEITGLAVKIGLCITVVAALTGLSIAIYVGALTPIVLIDPFAAAAAAAAAGVVSVIVGANAISKLTPCLPQLKYLQGLRAILEDQKTDILDICVRLDCFTAAWNLVWYDATSIKSRLDAVGDQGTKKAFMKRIDLMKARYTKLRDALNLYALQSTYTM